MEELKICITCGTQYSSSSGHPEICIICADDRQYIPEQGQGWITPEQLSLKHAVRIGKLQDNLFEFDISPGFAIGQRALLILSDNGNILWDCIPLLDAGLSSFIKSMGGLKAIAFSHPHYYSNMNFWAETFGCPVYIHENDSRWIVDRGSRVQLWGGADKELWDGMRIINTGGHFPGSCILHVPQLSEKGSVFCGDTFVISPDKKHVAIMYSYPNRIPLPLKEVQRINELMDRLEFDSMYSFLQYLNLRGNAKEVFKESMKKYL